MEVRASDVDGVLLRADGGCDGGDEAIRDVVDAVGMGEHTAGGVSLVGHGHPELVDHLRLARRPRRVQLAGKHRDDVTDGDPAIAEARAGLTDISRGSEFPGVEYRNMRA